MEVEEVEHDAWVCANELESIVSCCESSPEYFIPPLSKKFQKTKRKEDSQNFVEREFKKLTTYVCSSESQRGKKGPIRIFFFFFLIIQDLV